MHKYLTRNLIKNHLDGPIHRSRSANGTISDGGPIDGDDGRFVAADRHLRLGRRIGVALEFVKQGAAHFARQTEFLVRI